MALSSRVLGVNVPVEMYEPVKRIANVLMGLTPSDSSKRAAAKLSVEAAVRIIREFKQEAKSLPSGGAK